jgi:translation initiation factor IF-2
LSAAREGTVQDLPLIVKADSQGSIEALRSEMQKFSHPEVRVTIVHEGVGGVNESDVALAEASGAIIIAFHVVPEERARALAERVGVDVRRFEIIYEVMETIKRSLEGLLPPERKQVLTGRAFVMKTFQISRLGTIAGCRVLSGTIERSNRINVIRDQTILNSYDIASLKRVKDDAREVREGMECGIRLEGFNDIKEGDILEAYRVDEVKRTLD